SLSIKPAAQEVARALVEALERAELKTIISGEMSIAPNTELRLTSGQTVTLAEGSTVKLDPNSSVRVIGDVKIPQPSRQQLQVDARARNEELPFTAYTIFRSVPLASGQVVTGWNYDLMDMTKPKGQYCYYTYKIGSGVAVKYSLAFDGKSQPPPSAANMPVPFDEAVGNCVWFSGA